MFRRHFLLGLLLAPLVLIPSRTLIADQTILDADTLKKVLRPPTPNDEVFIDRMVKMVNQGTLPGDLFNSTFQWAKKKGKHRFQYFKQALILRAAEQGITIKP